VLTVLGAPPPAPTADAWLDIAGALAEASPAVIFIALILALLKGWLVLPRELADRDKRIVELEAERDEYKTMTFRALQVGERGVAVAEGRGHS